MTDKVLKFPTRDNTSPAGGGGSEPPMELIERVAHLETDMREVRDRLARVEIKLDAFATKADLSAAESKLATTIYQSINAQTWKLVTFVCSFGTVLVGATYYIATHVPK